MRHLFLSLALVIATSALYQPRSLWAGVVVDLTGADDVGDTFLPGEYFDITSLTADVTTDTVVFRVGFNQPISRVDPFDLNYVVGYIDLDIDRSAATGLDTSNVQFFAQEADPTLDFSGIGFGTDVYIDLFGFDPTAADVVNVGLDNSVTGIAAVSVDSTGQILTVSVDQVQDGSPVFGRILSSGDFSFGAVVDFHYGAIVGPIPSPTDATADDVAISFGAPPSEAVVPEASSIVMWGGMITVALLTSWQSRKRRQKRG